MTDLFVAPGFDSRDALAALLASPGMASLSPIAGDNLRARIALLDAGITGGTLYRVDTDAMTYTPVGFAPASAAAPAADAASPPAGVGLAVAAAIALFALGGRR